MTTFDAAWVRAVVQECDPVFESAGVGFVRQVLVDSSTGEVNALLWEADPMMFAERYPDSGIVERYGARQWPAVNCIDWWAYLDSAKQQARLSVEGWNLPDLLLPLSYDGEEDGADLADVFARLLGVASPRIG